jgi:hypothetical protein
MNTKELINWQTFKSKLQDNPELTLQFQYAEDKWVDASYHITEIKQAPIVSVDCGGVMNSWTEIIVQLWEPSAMVNERAMPVSKALSIVKLVEKSLPLNPLAVVKIEFGNSQFDTRQMYPGEFIIDNGNFIVNLSADFTQCKAISRGGNCDTPETVTCAPGSGCC